VVVDLSLSIMIVILCFCCGVFFCSRSSKAWPNHMFKSLEQLLLHKLLLNSMVAFPVLHFPLNSGLEGSWRLKSLILKLNLNNYHKNLSSFTSIYDGLWMEENIVHLILSCVIIKFHVGVHISNFFTFFLILFQDGPKHNVRRRPTWVFYIAKYNSIKLSYLTETKATLKLRIILFYFMLSLSISHLNMHKYW